MIQAQIFSKKSTLSRSLARLDPIESAVLLLVPFNYRSYYLYHALSKKLIYYIVMVLNAVPVSACRSIRERSLISFWDFFQKFFLYPKKRFVESALDLLIHRYYRVLGVHAADLCLLGGRESGKNIPYPVDSSTQLLWGHATDYDIFLNKRDTLEKPSSPFAVFIDQYIPFQNVSYSNDPHVSDPDRYYPSLRRFFTHLEEQLALPVVIAAHPRVPDIAGYSVFFGGRDVQLGDTIGLIHRSELVIAHASTATNFAILFNKPILFITTDELDNSTLKPYIDSEAFELGKIPLNVDGPGDIDPTSTYSIDREKYQCFKENYIKIAESCDEYLWQIVADYLKTVERP